jgi:acyl carrier protein
MDRIRGVIREHGRLAVDVDALDADSDLYEAGMTSHASVNLMLALENEFDVEFPDALLRRDVFESVRSISEALRTLGVVA